MQNKISVEMTEAEFRELIKASVRETLQEANTIQNNQQDKFFSLKEASIFLNLAEQTIYGFTSNRTIPFYKKGKKLFFAKNELELWVQKGKQRTKEEIENGILKPK